MKRWLDDLLENIFVSIFYAVIVVLIVLFFWFVNQVDGPTDQEVDQGPRIEDLN